MFKNARAFKAASSKKKQASRENFHSQNHVVL
jgi:hypothetical protein